MWIALLGPVEVRGDAGAPVEVAGARLATLLARLALDPRRLVTTEALIDAVWGEAPPAGATNALQTLVSRLRRALPPADAARLERLPGGYRLALSDDEVDVGRFERLAAEGRAARDAGDLATAARRFRAALDLWRGTPLAGLGAGDFTVATVARLAELRLRTVEDRVEVALVTGQPAELVAELKELTAAHPLRERLRGLQMRALCAAGRPAEALAAFEELRRTLAETLGTDPSPALRELHTAILRGDPGVAGQPRPDGGGRAGLRTALTSFVGREEELERIDALLDGERLVTLVGPGGAGKTRLAVEVAAGRAERTADGVFLVELAGVRDPLEVPAAASAALGLHEGGVLQAGPRGARGLVEALGDRDVLIVLDNCEHLIDAAARMADAVLGGCPNVRVLATSREPLAITGEVLCPVGPLPLPPSGVGVEEAPAFPAVRLFADRAAAVRPGFTLTADNLPAVVEVCRRLDGLPLAIELACARLRTLPADQIAARLGDRFRLLTSGSRTALPRHQTLLSVVEWSWELFGDAERTLARRLAVFVGGATLESAQAVCADEAIAGPPQRRGAGAGMVLPARDLLDVLSALVDKSFVELLEPPGEPPRYRMLDTIQAYAAGALAKAGEDDQVRRAHAAWFLARAEAAEPTLRAADQLRSLAWLEREYGNLTAALRWAVDRAEAETAVRLAAAMGWFWILRERHGEAASWLREVLAAPGTDGTGTVPPLPLAVASAYDAVYHLDGGEPERAARSAATARRLVAAIDEAPHPVIMLLDIIMRLGQGGTDAALVPLARLAHHPDRWVAAQAELFRGHAAQNAGDAGGAARHYATARDGFAAVGDRWGIAGAASALGGSHSLAGSHRAAIGAMSEAMELAETIGAQGDASWMRGQRGLERLRAGDLEGALADLRHARAVGQARRLNVVIGLAETGLGEAARHDGDLARARAVLAGALEHLDGADVTESQIRARTLTELGRVGVAGGDLGDARAQLDRALELARAGGDRSTAACVAEALADLALAEGEPGDAARLLGLATAARGAPDQGSPDVRRTEAATRAALGDGYDAAYGAAATKDAEAAVAALAAPRGDRSPARTGPAGQAGRR